MVERMVARKDYQWAVELVELTALQLVERMVVPMVGWKAFWMEKPKVARLEMNLVELTVGKLGVIQVVKMVNSKVDLMVSMMELK